MFRVRGVPVPQPRGRATIRKRKNGKQHASIYDNGKADPWKRLISIFAGQYRPPTPITHPVKVEAVFVFPRTQELLKPKVPIYRLDHGVKPDRDNLEKALLDALTDLGFWKNDAQVCCGEIRKQYAEIGEEPAVHVWITPRPRPW